MPYSIKSIFVIKVWASKIILNPTVGRLSTYVYILSFREIQKCRYARYGCCVNVVMESSSICCSEINLHIFWEIWLFEILISLLIFGWMERNVKVRLAFGLFQVGNLISVLPRETKRKKDEIRLQFFTGVFFVLSYLSGK